VGPEGGAECADGLFAAFTEVLQWGVVGDAESDLWDERYLIFGLAGLALNARFRATLFRIFSGSRFSIVSSLFGLFFICGFGR
jgi:hypothetical protein